MKKIMFCGGGSAGHVIPNLAICELLKNQYELCYLGTNGIEKGLCEKFGIRFVEYSAVKFSRGKLLKNLSIPFKLLKSVKDCKVILKDEKPNLLFCKGGYVSLAPALSAKKLGIPILTHESDLTLGLTNKLIARKCKRVLTTFQPTSTKIANGVCVGSPMRTTLFDRDHYYAKKAFGLDFRPTIIVFGGGSGSQKLNTNLRKIVSQVCRDNNVLHVCGKGNVVDSNVYGYKQVEFIDDMGLAYACADYAVARAGSNSACELIALKKPTLFIPLENKATRGDQVANAEYFQDRGLCHVLREYDLNAQSLLNGINDLFSDDKIKTALANNLYKCGNDNILREIKEALQ